MPTKPDYSTAIHDLRLLYGNYCAHRNTGRGECEGDLEFAHAKPTGLCGRGRGRAERYHDILNNLDCYVLMCSRHHKRFDAKKWTRGMQQGGC